LGREWQDAAVAEIAWGARMIWRGYGALAGSIFLSLTVTVWILGLPVQRLMPLAIEMASALLAVAIVASMLSAMFYAGSASPTAVRRREMLLPIPSPPSPPSPPLPPQLVTLSVLAPEKVPEKRARVPVRALKTTKPLMARA
jgi:hypothetical protein